MTDEGRIETIDVLKKSGMVGDMDPEFSLVYRWIVAEYGINSGNQDLRSRLTSLFREIFPADVFTQHPNAPFVRTWVYW